MTNTINTSKETVAKYDIHDRIFGFVVRVIRLTTSLPVNESNRVIIPQIIRCVTSIGANDQEADGTLTKKDFIHCYSIVRKEAKETGFWLKLIAETNPQMKRKMTLLLQENQELIAIFSAILIKARA
jgi:four helix bundle protein